MNVTRPLSYGTGATVYASVAESNDGDSVTATKVPSDSSTLTVSPLSVASLDTVELLVTAATPPAPVVKSGTLLLAVPSRALVPASDWS